MLDGATERSHPTNLAFKFLSSQAAREVDWHWHTSTHGRSHQWSTDRSHSRTRSHKPRKLHADEGTRPPGSYIVTLFSSTLRGSTCMFSPGTWQYPDLGLLLCTSPGVVQDRSSDEVWVVKMVGCEHMSDSEAVVRRIDEDTFSIARWTIYSNYMDTVNGRLHHRDCPLRTPCRHDR